VTAFAALVAEQQTYYRLRASVHEDEASAYMAPVIEDVVARMWLSKLEGRVLELACGTGHLTQHLSQMAEHVDAMDGSGEMLRVLAARGLPNVTPILQDIFSWEPANKWDAIFFSNWLSHVPVQLLPAFWEVLGSALQPGGRVIFLDATAAETRMEHEMGEEDGIPVAIRSVDGQTFRVIKHFWDPNDLLAGLREWGWSGTATPIGEEIGRGFLLYDVGRDDD
jgi:SAM-dependent methyltransferase